MTRFGFLSTYPPTRCGLATFTEALAGAMADPGSREARVVRVVDQSTPLNEARFGRRAVVAELVAGDASSRAASIRALDSFDIVIVQHEYGIYGGPDGDEVIDVLEGLTVPSIVVLHTVLDAPTVHQKQVLERVAELATSVVVMSDQALENLARYDVPMRKVRLIPHGVPESSFAAHERPVGHRILTWGLIGPGKGIEWGIRAMAELGDMVPRPEYVVVGKTHPKVLAHAGEAYRECLEQIVAELHLEDVVTFVDEYLDAQQLARYVQSADVVLVPYDTKDQVTSGVLVEAVAAGKPVISTRFPHAVELLQNGAGVIVDQQDATQIADAIRGILGNAGRAAEMSAAASRVSVGTGWTEVAQQYRRLAESILTVHAA
jgi:glycosyltransferase involved in cell wall biosynthesis